MNRGHVVASMVLGLLVCAGCASQPRLSVGEGEPCPPNGICNPGLVCLSNLCVNPGTDPGRDAEVEAAADTRDVPGEDEEVAAPDEGQDGVDAVDVAMDPAGEEPVDGGKDGPDGMDAEQDPAVDESSGDWADGAIDVGDGGPDDADLAGLPEDTGDAEACSRQCTGKQCGDDGCGETCGTCPGGGFCIMSRCVANPCPEGFVAVHPGEFDMGSPVGETGRFEDEASHRVAITHGYCLKATEVGQPEWLAVMGWNPSYRDYCKECPVERVSWWDALAYCNRLSLKDGLAPCYSLSGCTDTGWGQTCTEVTFEGLSCEGYRLPTEAEWEFAARAGTNSATYNGMLDSAHLACEQPNEVLDPIAWFCGNSENHSQPVKGKAANALGLFDMLGSVGEWVWDWYGDYPAGPVTDPVGPVEGTNRIARGGTYLSGARAIRAAYRFNVAGPRDEFNFVGLRPARTIGQ